MRATRKIKSITFVLVTIELQQIKKIMLCSDKFGIHNVDMEDPARARTPKRTAAFLKQIFADNGFVQDNINH